MYEKFESKFEEIKHLHLELPATCNLLGLNQRAAYFQLF